MTLYPPLYMQAVTGDAAISYTAQDRRLMISALCPNPGIVLAGDLAVTQRGAGANMSVDVAAGRTFVQGAAIANQGSYILRSDSVYNVPLTAANATNPRWDLIVATLHDKQADGGSTYGWTLSAVAGTPAATPTVPTAPTSSVLLAQVYVPAGATSVTTAANIIDQRPMAGGSDIPSWQLIGGNGIPIPSGVNTAYSGWSFSDFRGMSNLGNGLLGILTPGRYAVTFTLPIHDGGTAGSEFNVFVNQTRAGSWGWSGSAVAFTPGAFYRRAVSSNGPTLAGVRTVISATGIARCNVGDTLQAQIFQTSGVTLNVYDGNSEASFAGYWLGP